jgi:hypothetical protein
MAGSSRPYWVHSAPEESTEGMRRCARGEWCSGRVVTFENGERVVTPALTPRPYCDRCAKHIARCAGDLPGFWLRLEHAIGDPLQAEVPVRVPFGPQVLLREDVDAHLRLSAVLLGGWAARVRAVPQLVLSAPQHAYDSPAGVRDNARILAKHASVLLAMQPAWMTRTFRTPLSEEEQEWLADCEIVRVGAGYIEAQVRTDGEDAGRELQFLHYRARSLLLETDPPPEILITPCRNCTWRSLRRAWDRDLYSRCDHCGDEMTLAGHGVNVTRWLAYYRAHAERPVLGEVPAA